MALSGPVDDSKIAEGIGHSLVLAWTSVGSFSSEVCLNYGHGVN